MTEDRRIQLVAEVNTTQTREGFNEISQQASTMASSVSRAGQQASSAVSDIGSGADRSAKNVEVSQRNLIASIQRTTAAMEAGGKTGSQYYEVLARQRGVDVEVLRPYLAALDAITAKQKAAADAIRSSDPTMKQFGVSAAQTTAALRQMPAQLTDIFTSLSGGQNPLLVLIQQGGQIKDSFGGVSNTLSVLGGQVKSFFSSLGGASSSIGDIADLGGALADVARQQEAVSGGAEQAGDGLSTLADGANTATEAAANARTALTGVTTVSVTTVAAAVAVTAAVVAVAVAYYKGSQEADAYRKSIILTGNAAGTTVSQLNGMAASIAKQVGTQGQAAEALAMLAGTGKVGAENLRQFGATAVLAQKTIGMAVSDTVAAFSELGKSPLQASEKFTEQYHYMSLAVYSQIKALQDQGKTEEAAAVAQKAYSDAIESRGKEIEASLGVMQKGWTAVGEKAKQAWDWMLNVGREDTLDQKLEKAQAALAKAKIARFTFAGGGSDGKADLDKAQAEVEALQRQATAAKEKAAAQAESVRLEEAGIALAKEEEKYLPRKERLARDLVTARNLVTQAARPGEESVVTEQRIATLQMNIRKQYSDIFNAGIDSQIEAIKRRGEVEDIVSARSMAALTANRDAGLATGLQAQEEYASAVAKFDLSQFAAQKSRLENELVLTRGKANSEKDQATLRGEIAKLDEQALSRKITLTNELFVLEVKSTRAAMTATADLVDKRDSDLESLKRQVLAQRDANAMIGRSKQEVVSFNAVMVEEIAMRKENDAAILDTILGREQEADALRASAEEMRKLSKENSAGIFKQENFDLARKQWESIDSTAHDVFVNIFNGGKSAFDRLRDTLKSGLLDMLYQMTVKKWIFNIGAEMSGYSGIAASAGSVVSGLGSMGSAGTLISGAGAIKSGLGLVSGGLIGAGNSIGGFGSALGSTAIADFGAGLSGLAPAAAQAYGGTLSTAAGFGASINTAIAAVPGWGWAALGVAAIAGMSGLFSGGGPESNTRLQFASNNAVGAINNNERGESWAAPYIGNGSKSSLGTFGVRSTFWGDANGEVVQSFIKTVGQTDDALAAFMTTAEKATVSSYLTGKTFTANTGAEGTNPNATGELDKVFADRINNILTGVEPGLASLVSGFTGTSQALATEAAALLSYRAALKDSGEAVFGVRVTMQEIAALKLPTETTSAALVRVTSEFTATSQVAQLLGKDVSTAFGATGLASEAARAQLIQLSGGMATFSQQAASYAQTYLTDEERNKALVKQVTEQMSALGLASITTKDQFKALVMGLDLSSEADAKRYAALMKVSADFATSADATAAAIAKAQEAAKVTAGLDGQIYDLTHTAAEALARQRQVELSAMTATDAELQKRIYALGDEKSAMAAAKEKQAADLASIKSARGGIADEIFKALLGGKDLEGKIDQLKGAEAAAWSGVGSGVDSIAALEKIKALAMQRIDLEGQLQDKAVADLKTQYDLRSQGLTAELNAMVKMRDYAQQLLGFTNGLKLGDLSALSPTAKLAEAESQYRTTLGKARDGDVTAQGGLQGIAQTYLQLQKQYSGSTSGYASTYASVITALETLAGTAPTDPQIESQKLQISTIQSTSAALSTTVRDTSAKQVEVLQRIDAAMAKSQTNVEAQLAQAGAANAALVEELKKSNGKLAEIEARMARMEASA